MKVDHNIVGFGALGQAMRRFIDPNAKAVFFCVKAFDLEKALIEQHTKWPEDVPFITFTNGYLIPVFKKAAPKLKGRIIHPGMTTMGATLSDSRELTVYSEGSSTMWGNLKSIEAFQSQISEDERRVINVNKGWAWSSDITPVLCKKWIFNTTINTITAALSLKSNGSLMDQRELAEDVFKEAFELSLVLWGQHPEVHDSNKLLKELWILIEKTQSNENSMARDVRLGRKTESDFLAGLAEGFDGYPILKKFHRKIINIKLEK